MTNLARVPLVAASSVRGSVRIDRDRCKGCEFCVEFCPRHVLAFSLDLNPKGYHYPHVIRDDCADCKLCMRLCPEYAIFSTPQSVERHP